MLDHHRCPHNFGAFELAGKLSEHPGYFAFGAETVCYGNSSSGTRTARVAGPLYDVLPHVRVDGGLLCLLWIRTRSSRTSDTSATATMGPRAEPCSATNQMIRRAYYWLRPVLPVAVRRLLQRAHLRDWKTIPFPHWPVDRSIEQILERPLALAMKAQGLDWVPFIWAGRTGRRAVRS